MFLKKYLINLFSNNRFSKQVKEEDKYYEELFIKNPSWNTRMPNNDESKRWAAIKDFLTQINKKSNSTQILDLGCGRGWLSNLLLDYGTVIGVEPVKRVVDFAKKSFPQIHFRIGSTKELLSDNFEGNFDIVVSSEVIEHVLDKNKYDFVKDIRSLLKSNGYCIITTPRLEIKKELNEKVDSSQPVEEWLSESQLISLFENNGFVKENLKRVPIKIKKLNKVLEVYQVALFRKIN